MTYDYLTGNELGTHPFKDNSNLKASNDYVLAKDTIADLLIIGKQDIRQASLITITNVSSVVALTFRGVFEAGNQNLTISIPHGQIEKHKLFTASNDYFHVKLVLGSGFSTLTSAPATSTFAADLLEAVVIPPVPRVKSVTFNNSVEGLIAQISGSELLATDLTLEEGTNVSFNSINNRLVLIVGPGLGTGRHNPCDNELVIKSINFTTPDAYQNFLLLTDDCYETEKGFQGESEYVDNFGLTISNTCTPKCTATQLSSFAHYLNRIRDGMTTVAAQATDFKEELSDAIAAFNADTSRTAPIIKGAVSSFDNFYGAPYHSFVISFFNKSEVPVTANISITGHTAVEGSIRWKQGSVTELVSSLTSSTSVLCHSQARFEFTLQTSSPVTVSATCGSTSFSRTFIV